MWQNGPHRGEPNRVFDGSFSSSLVDKGFMAGNDTWMYMYKLLFRRGQKHRYLLITLLKDIHLSRLVLIFKQFGHF